MARLPSFASVLAVMLAALVGAGCAEPGPPAADADAVPVQGVSDPAGPAQAEAWSRSMDLRLAWVVGAGVDTFVGDTTVGATSHESCPRVMFSAPAGIAVMRFNWTWSNADPQGPGAGDYQVIIKSPDHVWMVDPVLASASESWKSIVDESAAPGIWEVALEPHGAAVNLTWVVSVTMEGAGALPDLLVYHDGDCI